MSPGLQRTIRQYVNRKSACASEKRSYLDFAILLVHELGDEPYPHHFDERGRDALITAEHDLVLIRSEVCGG